MHLSCAVGDVRERTREKKISYFFFINVIFLPTKVKLSTVFCILTLKDMYFDNETIFLDFALPVFRAQRRSGKSGILTLRVALV